MPKLDAETIRRKREKLQAELDALRAAECDAVERKNAIAGRALLDHALKDTAFAEQLMRILDRTLTKRKERKLFSLPAEPDATAPTDARAMEEAAGGTPADPSAR
jgi:hypothetical protein